ncbi:MAG: hypothetical protein KatS3mg035_2302 [Bacteroidia bacterium]|nr:MAG: hypothetical protein KatS3mg035_2302 [Bacteroidia bacterium]
MKRIKTNIIELKKLYEKPCEEWLDRFDNGKIDAHEAFKKYNQEYQWLYENSDYDLIGWEIENNCFDWEKHSWAVAKFCPEKFDADKYNWKEHSAFVAIFCPGKFDAKRYNWKNYSWVIAQFCPEKLDADKYNWERDSWFVTQFCPEKLKLKPKNI